MNDLNLPDELVTFLRRGAQLRYDTKRCECGQVTLLPPDALQRSDVWVNSDGSPLEGNDPHAGEEGYYAVPSVNLVASADGYDPEGILLWLPDHMRFGTWDLDHWNLLVFPHAKWSDIERDPLPYLNAQWSPDDVETEYLAPWPDIPFRRGRPF